jgi:hypothetical protein
MAPNLKKVSASGNIVEASETRYVNSHMFVTWLKHFIACVCPNPENKVLLVADGHTTHSISLETLNFARRNGTVLSRGHTTCRLQPLNVLIFGPKNEQAVEKWLRSHPGEVLTEVFPDYWENLREGQQL